MSEIDFRIPLLGRIWVAAFGTVWCGYFVVSLIVSGFSDFKGADPGAIALSTVVGAFGGTLCHRLFRLAVIADGDELVVRNYWRTLRIPRRQIRGFGIGRPSFGGGRRRSTITVETPAGPIPLDVFTYFPSSATGRFQSKQTRLRREPALNALLAWTSPSSKHQTLSP